jgi:hypothetical protein
MRPTIDGLNATEWLTVARVGTELLFIGVILWMVGRYLARAVRFIRDEREAERARRKAHEDWLAERARLANAPDHYVRNSRPAFRVIPND